MVFKDLVVGVKWSFVAQFSRQLLQLVTTVILVQLLSPEDFGLMGIALIITSFLNIFEDPGTSSSAIQKINVSKHFLSSIFWFNTFLGLCFVIVVFFSSHFVSVFFAEPQVENILKLLSITFLISFSGNLFKALAERNNNFDLLAKIELYSFSISSAAAIISAFYGFGVYSLVLRSICYAFVKTILLIFFVGWKPSFYFSWREISPVLNYSVNLTSANVVGYLMRNVDNIIIGKFLGTESLGYYSIAYRIMIYPLQNIVDAVKRVLFPILSRLQNNKIEAKQIYKDVTYAVFFLICPLMLGIIAINEKFVLVLLGEEWESVIVLIYLLVPLGILQLFSRMSGTILAATGKAGVLFIINLLNAVVVISAFLVGIKWGLVGVATSYLIANVLLFYPTLFIPFKIIELDFGEIFKSIVSIMIPALIMMLVVFALGMLLKDNNLLNLMIMITIGVAVFVLIGWKQNVGKVKVIYGKFKS